MALDEDQDIVDFMTTFSEDVEILRLMHFCVGRILIKLKNTRRNWREAGLEFDLKDVADWLAVSILHNDEWLQKLDDLGRPRKLLKFSDINGIINEANKAMAKRASKTPVIKITEGEEVIEERLGDGWYIVRLLTPSALDNESAKMQHCVGLGTYDRDLKAGKVAILSLRDVHNKPHVTIEIDTRNNSVVQIRGKQNATPKAEYSRKVRLFLNNGNFDSIYRPIEVGIVVDEMGRYHNIDNLPDGLAIKGNLNLCNMAIQELPAFLEVRGDLNIMNTPIRELPRGLKVSGNLMAKGSRLEALGLDHGIERSIDISNTPVRTLPDGLQVDGDLNASNSMLQELPKNLLVTGNLKIEMTDVSVFPLSVNVGRNLHLSGSALRHFEASTLYVGGCLLIDDCGRIHLPAHLTVELTMFMQNTEIASGASVLDIGKNLYCQKSNFSHQSRSVRVRGRMVEKWPARERDVIRAMPEPQFERRFGAP